MTPEGITPLMIYLKSYSELTVYFVDDHHLLRSGEVTCSQGVEEYTYRRQIVRLQRYLVVTFNEVSLNYFHSSTCNILNSQGSFASFSQVESDHSLTLEWVRCVLEQRELSSGSSSTSEVQSNVQLIVRS